MDEECGTFMDNENAYRVLVQKFDVRRPFGRHGLEY
jgi:hypothetical protein